MSNSIEVDGLTYGPHMIRALRIDRDELSVDRDEWRTSADEWRDLYFRLTASLSAARAEAASARAERDALYATVQRESADVNERGGVIAFLVGALAEVQKSADIEAAKTCAELAQGHIEEWHHGTWTPEPGDDPANWRNHERHVR